MDYAALSDQDLIDLLRTEEDRLPRAAVDEILKRGDLLSAPLMRLLEDESAWDCERPAWWAPVHAVFIVAAMKPAGALAALLRASEKALAWDVDWITEDLPAIYASFGPAAVPALKTFALDPSRNEYARWTSLQGLHLIARDCPESAPEVIGILRSAASEKSDNHVPEFAASHLLNFAPPEDRELLLSRAGEMYSRTHVEQAFKGELPAEPDRPRDWLRFYEPDEIRERQERWEEEDRKGLARAADPADERALEKDEERLEKDDAMKALVTAEQEEPIGPLVREGPKIGRNDPCPCGSAKKFKKCCGK